MVKLLAFSDIHGNVEAVDDLVRRASRKTYDGVIIAGDFTNALIDGDLAAAQIRFERIFDSLRRLDAPIYYVFGNRDYAFSQEGLRHIDPSQPTFLDKSVKPIRLGEICLTGNPDVVKGKTIYVTHFDRELRKGALLQIAGHVHWGARYRNYLNLGFLYRDQEHGAKPAQGCYFELETKGKQVNVAWNDLGGTKKISCRKHSFASFFVPSDWKKCPLCYEKSVSELRIFADDMPELVFFERSSELTRIPMVAYSRAGLLDGLGIKRIAEVAKIDPQKLCMTPEVGNSKDTSFTTALPLIINYARAIDSGEPIVAGSTDALSDLITEPYFVDLEYDPVGTKTGGDVGIFTYGIMDSKGKATQRFLDDPTQEAQLLEWFVDWISRTRPTIFTYSSKSADEPHLRNSIRKFGLPTNTLSAARFIDLYYDVIFTQSSMKQRIFLPIEGHIGEKNVSDYFGYHEPKGLRIHDGLGALIAYRKYSKNHSQTIKHQILSYNRSDLERIALIYKRLRQLLHNSNRQKNL